MKGKTIILAIVLIAVVGGSSVLYNRLNGAFRPQSLPETPPAPEAPEASGEEVSAPGPQDGEPLKAPDFTVKDIDGNDVKLSDMLGKPVVLNFWASWCPPCKSEMPGFDKVYLELGGDVSFMMVDAVDGVRETQEKGAEYISKQGYSFPVYFDVGQAAVVQYGVRAFPTSIFIDKDGHVVAGVEGAIDEATLRKGIGMITETEKPVAYQKITPEEAKRLIDGNEPYILLDVRTESEFAQAHIEGAVLIPDYEIAGRAASELPDKSLPTLVYCRTGRRSAEAAKKLADMGYTNVYDFGGILDWPYETAN